jgi:hypothetical protein
MKEKNHHTDFIRRRQIYQKWKTAYSNTAI